jgi:hypothetical protein
MTVPPLERVTAVALEQAMPTPFAPPGSRLRCPGYQGGVPRYRLYDDTISDERSRAILDCAAWRNRTANLFCGSAAR